MAAMCRRFRSLAALLALGGMMFLQAATALAACERPAMGLAAMHAAAMPDCHEAGAPEPLCLAHCQNEDQTLGKLPPGVPDLAEPRILVIGPAIPRHAEPRSPPVFAWPAPPRRILSPSFQL